MWGVLSRTSGMVPDTAPKEQFNKTLEAQTPEKTSVPVLGTSDSANDSPGSVAEIPESLRPFNKRYKPPPPPGSPPRHRNESPLRVGRGERNGHLHLSSSPLRSNRPLSEQLHPVQDNTNFLPSTNVRGETFMNTSRHGDNAAPLLRLIPETRAQHTSPPSNRRGRR